MSTDCLPLAGDDTPFPDAVADTPVTFRGVAAVVADNLWQLIPMSTCMLAFTEPLLVVGSVAAVTVPGPSSSELSSELVLEEELLLLLSSPTGEVCCPVPRPDELSK